MTENRRNANVAPQCLWITREVPYPPAFGGDVLYTSHLIESLAKAGSKVHVFCRGIVDRVKASNSSIEWTVTQHKLCGKFKAIFSPLPNLAARHNSRLQKKTLESILNSRVWDVIIIDHLASAWALPIIQKHTENRDPILTLYLSHNHEKSVRVQLAQNFSGNYLTKLALLLDAIKTRHLEKRVVEYVNYIGTNTESDASRFISDFPDAKTLTITPGYGGDELLHQTGFEELPHKVVIVGSFHWVAKKHNLEAFLEVAAAKFHKHGITLTVVGTVDSQYAETLENRYPCLDFIGEVDSVTPFIRAARIGLIIEVVGGGFKHKALSYIFNRVPFALIEKTADGLPISNDLGYFAYENLESMVDGVLQVIDDTETLYKTQEIAYLECKDHFCWDSRGQAIHSLLTKELS